MCTINIPSNGTDAELQLPQCDPKENGNSIYYILVF